MRIRTLIISSLLAAAPAAWAIPSPTLDDSDSAPAASAPGPADSTTYSEALALMKQGDTLNVPGATGQSVTEARQAYAGARAKLQALTARSPQLAEAWNSLGYTQRQLGSYDDALASYARALTLRPGYPEALEYRGEAYLRLGRIADAKQAYLDLFAANRKIAAQFLDAIQIWVKQQQAAKTANATAVAEFGHWAQERAQIASQTASLTREGTAASWQ